MSILRVRTQIGLDVHDTTCQATISVTQGDNTRGIIATLVDHGKPVELPKGAYVCFCADRTVEEEDEQGIVTVVDAPIIDTCVVDHRNGTVIYDIPEDTTRADGLYYGQLTVFAADGSVLMCPSLSLAVRRNRFPRAAVGMTGFDTFADLIRQFSAEKEEIAAEHRRDMAAMEEEHERDVAALSERIDRMSEGGGGVIGAVYDAATRTAVITGMVAVYNAETRSAIIA